VAVRLMNPVVLRGVGVNYHALFCACRGGPNCRNQYNIDKERASEDDSDDCAEADCNI